MSLPEKERTTDAANNFLAGLEGLSKRRRHLRLCSQKFPNGKAEFAYQFVAGGIGRFVEHIIEPLIGFNIPLAAKLPNEQPETVIAVVMGVLWGIHL